MLREANGYTAILSVGGCGRVVGRAEQLIEITIWPSVIQIAGAAVFYYRQNVSQHVIFCELLFAVLSFAGD